MYQIMYSHYWVDSWINVCFYTEIDVFNNCPKTYQQLLLSSFQEEQTGYSYMNKRFYSCSTTTNILNDIFTLIDWFIDQWFFKIKCKLLWSRGAMHILFKHCRL